MSKEKRAASNSFSSSQLVKKQKSDGNLNGRAVAVTNGGAKNGALIKSVCLSDYTSSCCHSMELKLLERAMLADMGWLDRYHVRVACRLL